MLLDGVELLVGQRPGLRSTSSGTPILPMSWSSARGGDLEVAGRQRQRAADGHRQHADALGVAGGVRVARVERGGERADGAGVGRFGFGFAWASEAMSTLKVSINASTSRLDPPDGTAASRRASRPCARSRSRAVRSARDQPRQRDAAGQRQDDRTDRDEREVAHRLAHRAQR